MEWEIKKCLAEGSFGNTVFLAASRNPNIPFLVLKSAKVENCFYLHKEDRILRQFCGCNEVVQCYGATLSVEEGIEFYNLKLEYASGGSLFDFMMTEYGGKIPERDVQRCTKMLLKGLSCIHGKRYVHADIKPENILVFPSDQLGFQLKIADFGLAGEVNKDKVDTNRSCRGTPGYMSPETVLDEVVTPASDIWSLGCTVVEMITGETAYEISTVDDWLKKIRDKETPRIPTSMSEEGKDFLKLCFKVDPCRRPTADMLLKHPFVMSDDKIITELIHGN